MQEFSVFEAWKKIEHIMAQCQIRSYSWPVTIERTTGRKTMYITDKNGLRLTPHKNTWKRKRETGHMIRIEYWHKGSSILVHVEPWANYPSDHLIARLMLLPPYTDTTGHP